MSKKLLLGIIVVLIITNIATLIFVNNNDAKKEVDEDDETVRADNESVATIDGEEITYVEWIRALRREQGEQQLKAMIDRQIVEKLAKDKDIEIHDKIIERDLAYLTSMQGILEEEELAEEKEKWEKETIYRYQLEFLLTEDISVSEEEIQNYYNSYQNQYNFNSGMQLSHILVEDMDTAEKIYSELEEGASFDLLAQEYSIDEETSHLGGYLGFMETSSQFLPDGYGEVVNNLEEHSYSEPFTVGNGVAIIYLHQKLPEIEFTFEEIKPYIKSELALHKENLTLNADSFWEDVEVDWIFSNTIEED